MTELLSHKFFIFFVPSSRLRDYSQPLNLEEPFELLLCQKDFRCLRLHNQISAQIHELSDIEGLHVLHALFPVLKCFHKNKIKNHFDRKIIFFSELNVIFWIFSKDLEEKYLRLPKPPKNPNLL